MSAATNHAVTPVNLALREGLRRFDSRRVRAENVDDVVQDILMRMHEHAGELRDDARLPGWAFRIARSVVADHHRALRAVAQPAGRSDEAFSPAHRRRRSPPVSRRPASPAAGPWL